MVVSKGAAVKETAVRAAAVLAAAAAVSVVAASAKADLAREMRRGVAEAAEVHLLEAQGGSWAVVATVGRVVAATSVAVVMEVVVALVAVT